ncbi:MAG: MFS transporter [Nocardioides sp.]|nr:MFS transporter [Nocardioides sp.]
MTVDDSRRVAMLLGVLFGLAGMGSSSAAIALPLMAADLGVSVGVATWSISLYVLMLAVTTALYGRIADLVGVRIPLLVGVGLMTLGALVASVAPSFELLVLARMLQGAGAAAIPTLGVTLLSNRYDGAVRGLALGRLAGIAAAVTCLGPLAGGLVESLFGWRAVMMLPVLGALVLPFLTHTLAGGGTGARLDVLGALLVSFTAGGLVLVVQSPSSGFVVAGVGMALMVLGTPSVVWRVRARPHGFLPVVVIRNGAVLRSAVAAAAIPASWFALLVAVPAVLLAEGWEAWQVGLLLLPSAIVALLMPKSAGRLLARYGPARTLAISSAVAAGAIACTALGVAFVSAPLLVLAVMACTISFGVGQPAMGAAVGEAVTLDVRGVALGVATLLFLVGGSIGSAVVGGLGDALGLSGALAVVGLLPLLGIGVLMPELRRTRRERRPA